jgi:hypothetical protein
MRKIETVNFVFQPFNNAFLKTLLILPYLKSTLKCAEKQNKKEVLKKYFIFSRWLYSSSSHFRRWFWNTQFCWVCFWWHSQCWPGT